MKHAAHPPVGLLKNFQPSRLAFTVFEGSPQERPRVMRLDNNG
jgi:hypothetical protein